jgi:hypothetical protein
MTMATTRLMTTVLPHSADPAETFHLSLYFTHRLEGSGHLTDYAPMVNWVHTLQSATVTLHTDNSAAPIACTPQLQAASENAWRTTFPPQTEVRDFAKPTVSTAQWKTFPASKMPDHAVDAHQTSLLASPVGRPSASGSRLAGEVLRVFTGIQGLSELIEGLQGYERYRNGYLSGIAQGRAAAAQAALTPHKPAPGQNGGPGGPGGPAVAEAAVIPPHVSAIGLLHAVPDLDDQIDSYLEGYADGTRTATEPTERMLRDAHITHNYYWRPEEQPTPPAAGAAAEAAPVEVPPDPDFHERVSAAGGVRALLRALGLVVDVTVDTAALATLKNATRIWCEVTVDGVETYAVPKTICAVDGDRFYAVPSDADRWSAGLLKVGNDSHYTVMDLDPDAAGLALEQLLRSAIRARAVEANGDSGSFSPAAMRSTGFAIAEIDRPDRLKPQLQDSEHAQQNADTGAALSDLHYEAVLRGLRVEVWDDHTDAWHSLHERTVTASFGDAPIFDHPVPDTGLLQNPPMNRVPGDDQNPYYVHEVLAGWDGWSLSAPRPWKEISDPTAGPAAPHAPGLEIQSVAAAGSLPALRYGRTYSFRIAGVDLAGNSVTLPQETATPLPAQIDSAETHLDAVRAHADEQEAATLAATLNKNGTLAPSPPADSDNRKTQIERTMTSVLTHAGHTRVRPELAVTPEHLAALFAAAGDDPATASAPRPFLRWDAVTPPTLVPRGAYLTGESLQRMVIRTGLTGTAGLCERHVVPPKGSELEAEQDGRLDDLMRRGDNVHAYAIALKERGNLFSQQIQDLDDPSGTIEQPGIALVSPANVTEPTLGQLQNPDIQPAAGQYVVHDVDDLMVPYLPDPMAVGFSLVFYEAGADHVFDDPRELQSVTITYSGSWPSLQPLRLVVHDAPKLDARQEGRVINIGLPRGEQVGVRLSSTLDDEHLNKMGLWVINPVNDPNTPTADRDVLASAARDGWLWWLTPDEDLRLVHATARPAIAPRISRLIAEPRTPGVATANLDGVLDVHGASTDKVELRAHWSDPVDDPLAPAPTTRNVAEVVADYRIGDSERYSLLTLETGASTVGSRTVDEPIRTAIHNLPDTKARTVTYQLHGTSRYREFFAPNELPPVDDPGSMGNEVAVNIPSSAAPAPPAVHDVIPMFMWEQTTEPEHPFAVRRTRRTGVRIWLDRPWFSSGDGEMLAIITTGDPNLVVGNSESVAFWGRDPILAGATIANAYEVPVLSAWQQRAVQLKLAPESLAARPQAYVVKDVPATPDGPDKVVNAYAYRPEFHPDRNRWFVDAVLESRDISWPFLRLAVARYQPNSLAGLEFSPVVATDFAQLPPERIGTLSRPDADHVRISLTGVTVVTPAPGITLPAGAPDHDTLADLLTRSHRVVATVQARSISSDSDLEWFDGTAVDCVLAGLDAATFTATWSAELPLTAAQQLNTPGTSADLRVQIEEYELLPADPRPGEAALTVTERLVYADHFYL